MGTDPEKVKKNKNHQEVQGGREIKTEGREEQADKQRGEKEGTVMRRRRKKPTRGAFRPTSFGA